MDNSLRVDVLQPLENLFEDLQGFILLNGSYICLFGTFLLDKCTKITLLAQLTDHVDVVGGLAYLIRMHNVLLSHHLERFDFVAQQHVLNLCLIASCVDDLNSDWFLGCDVSACMDVDCYHGTPAR